MKRAGIVTGQVLLVTLVYFVAARLSLFLAIPPGFASAVWPAAGIALAAVLIAGYQVSVGIALGSFLANLFIGFDATAPSGSTLMAASIATGATLQAICGAWLVHRMVGFPTTLEREDEICKFLCFGGPVSCLVSSTIGAGTLLAVGAIQRNNVLFSWFTWWVGDTIGVLIFAPLTLILFAKPNKDWKGRRATVVIPLSVTFAVVTIVFCFARSAEFDRTRRRFEMQAEMIYDAIHDTLQARLETVTTIRDLFEASNHVDRREFASFVKRSLQEDETLQTLEWIPRVPASERDAFVKSARVAGLSGFEITERARQGKMVPAGQRDEYFPVYYVEPLKGNELAIGFDLVSDAKRFQALEQSRDSGMPVATGRITLVQEIGQQYGVLMIVPVYKQGSRESVAARRENLEGFAIGVFRIGDLANEALRRSGIANIYVRLEDLSAKEEERLLVHYLSGGQPRDLTHWRDVSISPDALRDSHVATLAGRKWQVSLQTGQGYVAAGKMWYAWTMLAGGLSLVSCMGAFLLIITGKAKQVAQIVVQRTAQLRQATADAHDSNRAKSRFLSNMSHEIRTPMTAILGFVDILSEEEIYTRQGRERVETIRRNGQHLLRLINDILDLTKIDSGKMRVEHIDCDVAHLINDVVGLLKLRADEKRLALRVCLRNAVPQRIQSDPTRLQQILINLLENAIKFTEQGSVELGLSCVSETNDDAPRLQFEVKDTGMGMSSEKLEQIFDPFTQADDSVTRLYGGTGLGLTICRTMAELLGGDLEVESQLGAGSTFRFTISTGSVAGVPMIDEMMIGKERAAVPGERTEQMTQLSAKVLLAEDGPDNQRLIAFFLKKAGATVTIVNDGGDAVQEANRADSLGDPYDVILMDMQMPVLDGYSATKQLRAGGYNRPIIAVTAHAMAHDRDRCLEIGCDDYMTKPIDRTKLLSVVGGFAEQTMTVE